MKLRNFNLEDVFGYNDNNGAQCYDKTNQTWYNIRAEPRFLGYLRIASRYGSFILALNPLVIYWMFNCDDLRKE